MFTIRKGNQEYGTKSVRMPKWMIEELEKNAKSNDISFSNLVIQCVSYAMNHRDGEDVVNE